MVCPFLSYQSEDETNEFDHDRPYCTVSKSFVSPMQADVCNDRHDFEHTSHCEVYREAVAERIAPSPVGED